jgi:hypothetical protein
MVTDNALVLLIVLPQDTDIPTVSVNMGFDGSVKSRWRSRDPKRRDERILHLPGEQESVKKIIRCENDWIIWRVKPSRGEPVDRVGENRNCQETTDFLEKFGTKLEEIQPKGGKTQRTSESISRRRGWYRTNDIRTLVCNREMEIWIPKSGRTHSMENIQTVWHTWRNDAPNWDECRVQLEGPKCESAVLNHFAI